MLANKIDSTNSRLITETTLVIVSDIRVGVLSIILLLLATWLGYLIHRDSGYILIYYANWSIETSLWVGLTVLIIAFLAFYMLFRLISKTLRLKKFIRHRQKTRIQRYTYKYTKNSLNNLAVGQWQAAQKQLLKLTQKDIRPTLNYLAAAYCAQQQGNIDQRNQLLQHANSVDDANIPAVLFTTAKLQIMDKQWEQALVTLTNLRKQYPSYHHSLQLLKTVYIELNEWDKLNDILPDLARFKLLNTDEIEALAKLTTQHRLTRAVDTSSLYNLWNSCSRLRKKDPNIICSYAKRLIDFKEEKQAQVIIEKTQKNQWIPDLTLLYSQLSHIDTTRQLATVEKWHQEHPNDISLLLAIANLAEKDGFHHKAIEHLKQAYSLKPSSHIAGLLAKTYDTIGSSNEALQYMRHMLSKKYDG